MSEESSHTPTILPPQSVLALMCHDALKRFLDILGSLTILAFTVPIMVIISCIIRASSSGPAIYCQRRLTTRGRVFTMFKFRTMVSDAELESGAVWAQENDPRVTSVGRFLRRTRLDELPQVMNVLIGDMSLIGPRPERPEIAVDLIKQFPNFMKRYEVPAGLSGLAQVEAGYAASVDSYQEKLRYDLEYVRNRSLALDLKIAWKTIYVVISGHGAR